MDKDVAVGRNGGISMAEYKEVLRSGEICVNVDDMLLTANICINVTDENESFTVEELTDILGRAEVVYGVQKDILKKIVDDKLYGMDMVVAKGKPAGETKDGWFEFFFDTDPVIKPKILEDGSVDYTTYGEVPSVEEGDVLAKYHPAVTGEEGITVRNTVLVAKPGRNLAQLRGRNFTLSPDKLTYTAAVAGKATYANEKLRVSEFLEVLEDVSHLTGDIHFRGDIMIRGSVLTGCKVESDKGNIFVDGFVEGATLIAGQDVTLKNGMQGNGRGTVQAGGNVSAKFLEQVVLDAKGTVTANAIMNCEVHAGEDVLVSGRFGIIIGGSIFAERRVESTIIGNMAEIKTIVEAGSPDNILALLTQSEKTLEALENEVEKINSGIAKIDSILEQAPNQALQVKKLQLLRVKIERDARVKKLHAKREELLVQMEKLNNARICVNRVIYPGACLTLCGNTINVKEENHCVEYMKRGNGVVAYHP